MTKDRDATGTSVPAPLPIIAKFCFMRHLDIVLKAFMNKQRQSDQTDQRDADEMRKKKEQSTKIIVAGTKVLLKYRERGTGGTFGEWKKYTP